MSGSEAVRAINVNPATKKVDFELIDGDKRILLIDVYWELFGFYLEIQWNVGITP